MRTHVLRASLACLLLASVGTRGSAMDEAARQATLARVEALHPAGIVFARPVHGPKLRALFVIYDSSIGAAACVARRLEMEWDAVGWCKLWHKPSPELIQRALDALQRDWDVIVVGGRLAFRHFPAEVQHALYEKAIAGTGVVVLTHEHPFPREIVGTMETVPAETVLAGVALGAFEGPSKRKAPAENAKGSLDPFGRFIPAGYEWKSFAKDYRKKADGTTRKQVRVVRLPFRGAGWGVQASLISAPAGGVSSPALRITDETYLSMLCKAIRWAAGQTPAVRVLHVTPEGQTCAPAQAVEARVALDAGKALGAARLVWTVRTGALGKVAHGTEAIEIAAGAQEAAFTLPALGAGCYYLDVQLQVDGKTVDWGSGFFRVRGAARIEAIETAKPGFDRGERVTGTVWIADAPPKSRLAVSLADGRGRVLARTEMLAGAGASTFELAVPEAVNGITFALRAAVIAEGVEQAEATVYVPIRRPDPDFVWNLCLAEDNQDWFLARLRRRVLRPYRVDADNYFGARPYQALLLGRDGIAAQGRPFLYGGLVDEKRFGEFEAKLRATVRALTPTGLLYVNTGDDTHPATSVPEAFHEAFRAYLKRKHGDLAGLQKAWGVEVAGWEAVDQAFIDDRKKEKNFAPITDALLFCEDHFFNGLGRLRTAGREEHPEVRIGQFAVGGFGMGLGAYLQNVDYFAPYYRDVKVEILGAFHGKLPHGYYGSNGGYFGTSGSPDLRANEPWYTLLSGGNIVHFWYTPARLEGDFSVHPLRAGVWWRNAAEIKRGIGMQVLRAERRVDPVAILYSRESGYANKHASQISEIANSRKNVNGILHDLGLQYRYVSGPQVAAGVLDRTATRLLVLPYCQAVGQDEADAIRAFVEAGGTVLADTRPAVWDELCRPLERGRLDDVFGIQRTQADAYVVYGDLTLTRGVPGLDANAVIDSTTADSSVAPATAQAHAKLGDTPAVLVNAFGEGRGVLLNTFIGRYRLRQADGKSQAWTALYRWVVEEAGVPTDRIRAEQKGAPAIAVRRVSWTNESMELLGVRKRGLGAETYPVEVTLTLPAPRHIYGMRDGKYFGKTETFTDAFRASQTRFYALLPYKVEGLAIELPERAHRGEVLEGRVALQTAGGAPAPHVLLVQVLDKHGAPLHVFEQKLWAHKGAAALHVPLAYNEAPGAYTVRVQDIPTGVVGEATFTVED